MPDPRYQHWPKVLQEEIIANRYNPCVGTVLVSETDRVRIWHLRLPPGRRCPFHRHVLDYFWTCHSSGTGRYYYEDGSIVDKRHFPGQTKHLSIKVGEYMFHCVENIGDSELIFTTVEHMQSANQPLAIPDEIRLKVA